MQVLTGGVVVPGGVCTVQAVGYGGNTLTYCPTLSDTQHAVPSYAMVLRFCDSPVVSGSAAKRRFVLIAGMVLRVSAMHHFVLGAGMVLQICYLPCAVLY
eukprot:2130690-Rhodomonas_salina.3